MQISWNNTNLILYGAGYCGYMVADLLLEQGIHPLCFFDRKEEKQGKNWEGIPIQKPTYVEDATVVVTMLTKGALYASIATFLKQLGFSRVSHIYDLQNEAAIFKNQKLVLIPKQNLVASHATDYACVEKHLADAESKKVLQGILAFLQGNVDAEIPCHAIQEQYLDLSLYRPLDEEIVVDCGGFKGDILRFFVEQRGLAWKQYHLIEPDAAYVSFIRENIPKEQSAKVQLYQRAVSNQHDFLKIKNYGNENSVVTEEGLQQVEAWPLDDFLEQCTLLKIDTEGYEKKVLQGATQLIQRNRPVIAVAAYHTETEFYEIWQYIEELVTDYVFYLRSYMNFQESILYAVPRERCIHENVK